MTLAPPEVWGLPTQYTSWRKYQADSILYYVDMDQRFVAQACPTGSGKSLSYITSAVIDGGRVVILTSTKGLQSQLMRDFSPIGLVDIRGRNAYICRKENDGSRCDQGPCIAGVKCDMRDGGGCDFYDALRLAKRSKLVVTNYAFWMTINKKGEGLGKVDLLICDEAHQLPDLVSGFLTLRLDRKDELVRRLIPDGDLNHISRQEWRDWAKIASPQAELEVEMLTARAKAGGSSKSLRRRLSMVKAIAESISKIRTIDDTWVMDNTGETVEFCPVWPAPYCESIVFMAIPRVYLTSAILCYKTLDMLGIKSVEVKEYPHTFPLANRMLIYVPTVRMNVRTNAAGMKQWLSRIDQILSSRMDRKGIVHTVSYKRRDMLVANSKWSSHMITHARANTEAKVLEFKRATPPLILISPSMTTGWDFPYDECRYQILGKIAYPDSSSGVVKARSKADQSYTSYVAMQKLVQTCGRGLRAYDDQCENFIIDDNITWFMRRYSHFAPNWFTQSLTLARVIPPPLKLTINK